METKKRYSDLLFALIMGFAMVLIITFANTSIRIGFTNAFMKNWITNFSIGYPIAVPLILILPGRIRKFIARIMHQ
jgi:hypothetical protein